MSKPYSQPGEKGTDTNQASELFSLCKKVYERTGWLGTLQVIWNDKVTVVDAHVEKWAQEEKYANYAPLYTSDYLLEKLRETKRIDVIVGINRINEIQCYAKALNLMELNRDIKAFADTPLKALLKLTIALSEAGELK